jgi:hypothetical protein
VTNEEATGTAILPPDRTAWRRIPPGRVYLVELDGVEKLTRAEDAAYRFAPFALLHQCSDIEVRGRRTRTRFAVEVRPDGALRCVPVDRRTV